MSNIIGKIAIFVSGAGIGAVVTWKAVEAKYKKIADEEIKEVKEYYRTRYSVPNDPEDNVEEEDEGPTREEYVQFVKNETNYTSSTDDSEKGVTVTMDKPYVITPAEYSESEYNTTSMTYYADGVLTDELDDIVENVDDIIGIDLIKDFDEHINWEFLYVRNEALEIDYEIWRDARSYAEVHSNHTEQ